MVVSLWRWILIGPPTRFFNLNLAEVSLQNCETPALR